MEKKGKAPFPKSPQKKERNFLFIQLKRIIGSLEKEEDGNGRRD